MRHHKPSLRSVLEYV
uniref:Uncharacterized protein n=1 Tax=Arundo donax TaxID=35708 RepID=A0A0A8ZHU0_ARUDO